MTIFFYGRLAAAVGERVDMEVSTGRSIGELREALAKRYPEIAEQLRSRRVRACIGDSIVQETHVVAPGERIEFFPPVSGG